MRVSVGLEDLISLPPHPHLPPLGSSPLNTDAPGGTGFALPGNEHSNQVGIVAENFSIRLVKFQFYPSTALYVTSLCIQFSFSSELLQHHL